MPFDRGDAIRELQLASLPDIQGSIQANDTKSSAALVVHGLLFAGVVSIVAQIGDVFDQATLVARIGGGVLLLFAALAFGVSVLQLIKAARPHDPRSTREAIGGRSKGAFFPPADPRRRPPDGPQALDKQLARLARLQTQADFEREYAGEQIKLADVRATQAYAAKRGFAWLERELGAVAGFLALVVLVALGAPYVAKEDDDERRAPLRVSVGAGATVDLRDGRAVTLTVDSGRTGGRPLELTLRAP
ncbi:MAG TPA: hypothetical protein VHF89_13005 [Solirubrobacteraceae bacterium]|nr:hypothetical protein [Solirubrobacteraceae bacterium]